jgi:hypothetical protein
MICKNFHPEGYQLLELFHLIYDFEYFLKINFHFLFEAATSK